MAIATATQIASLVAKHPKQGAAVYDPERWARTLSDHVDPALLAEALKDDKISQPGRRTYWTVDRAAIYRRASNTDFTSENDVLRLFWLVTAWGNGTKSARGFLNTKLAFANDPQIAAHLSCAATALQRSSSTEDLDRACLTWQVKHIAESFYTKWFAFAGTQPGRAWQPLILDKNVRSILTNTLHAPLSAIASTSRPEFQYRPYVEAVHAWAEDLKSEATTADEIEYALFAHNGAPLPQ